MKTIGLALSTEDISRIIACVGTMSMSLMRDAENDDDVKEAIYLGILQLKLVDAIKEANLGNEQECGVMGDTKDVDEN